MMRGIIGRQAQMTLYGLSRGLTRWRHSLHYRKHWKAAFPRRWWNTYLLAGQVFLGSAGGCAIGERRRSFQFQVTIPVSSPECFDAC